MVSVLRLAVAWREAVPTRLRGCFAPLVTLALVAACATPSPAPRFPELTYAHLGPIRLDVAVVEIIDEYVPPLRAPNVEHAFPATPAAAARRWAQDRLVAVGGDRKVVFIIRDASVTESALDVKEGVEGTLTTDQATRYHGEVVVHIEIRGIAGWLAYVEANASRARSAPEDISLNERDQLFFEMTEGLITDLNGQLEANIRTYFADYLR